MYLGLQEAEVLLSCNTLQHSSRRLCNASVTNTKHASPATALSVAFAALIMRNGVLHHVRHILAAAAAAVHAMLCMQHHLHRPFFGFRLRIQHAYCMLLPSCSICC